MNLSDLIKKIADESGIEEQPAQPVAVFSSCRLCSNYKDIVDGYCPDCTETIKRGYQISRKQGRNWNGAHQEAGYIFHARMLDEDNAPEWKALCGTEPGRRSGGWSYGGGEKVTCERCIKKLQKLGN